MQCFGAYCPSRKNVSGGLQEFIGISPGCIYETRMFFDGWVRRSVNLMGGGGGYKLIDTHGHCLRANV